VLIIVVISLIFEGSISRALKSLDSRNSELEKSRKELIEQQEEMRAISERLKELNEKKDDLLYIIAHDLKSPLANIQALVNLSSTHGELNGLSNKQMLDMVGGMAGKSQQLIHKILSTENIEQVAYDLNLELLDISGVVHDVVENAKRVARDKNISIHFKKDDQDYKSLVDKIYLNQVFENLIYNAIKFSPPGKQVTIELQSTERALRATIKDEGPGIKNEEKEMLFKKFAKLSNQPTGEETSSGLGLSIVKHYLELLNGRVWCESEYGKGSSFIVELPRH
jgi:signal transduction histidine kinase